MLRAFATPTALGAAATITIAPTPGTAWGVLIAFIAARRRCTNDLDDLPHELGFDRARQNHFTACPELGISGGGGGGADLY